MNVILHRLVSLAEASQALSDWVLGLSRRHDGVLTLALPGGRTPDLFLRLLSRAAIGWERAVVFPADERWVSPDHPDSNEGMIRRSFFGNSLAEAAIRSLFSPNLTPAEQCEMLDLTMRPADIAVLGLGEDGHIASLFPMHPVLMPSRDSRFGWLDANPKDHHRRITLTEKALADVPHLAILIQGQDKVGLVETILSGSGTNLPVSLITRRMRETVVFSAS